MSWRLIASQNPTCTLPTGMDLFRIFKETPQIVKTLAVGSIVSPLWAVKDPPWVSSSQCFDLNTPQPSIHLPRGQQAPHSLARACFHRCSSETSEGNSTPAGPDLLLLSAGHPGTGSSLELLSPLPHGRKYCPAKPDPFLTASSP